MERKNHSAFKRKIKERCSKIPLKLEYERTSEPYESYYEESEHFDYLGKRIGYNTWTRVQQKYGFIYRVIFTKLYHNDEGRRLNISDAEIQTLFNKFVYTLEVLEEQDHLEEFHDYLHAQAKAVLELEKKEQEAYNKKSLLRKLIDNDSMLSLQNKAVDDATKRLKEVNSKMNNLFNDWKHKKISTEELAVGRDKYDDAIEYYRDLLNYLTAKYKATSENGHYRRRKNVKNCFHYKDLYNPVDDKRPQVRHKNLSTVKFMLEEYCVWYNRTFAAEIAAAKKTKEPSAREQERLRRFEVLTPYKESKLSISKISEETGISKSAVQRILSELRVS